MMLKADPDISSVVILTVTFNPDMDRLRQQIDALPAESQLVVVDNASAQELMGVLEAMLAERPRTSLIKNVKNVGLAAALNQAAWHAQKTLPDTNYLLLMDQDSVPAQGSVQRLLAAHLELERQGIPVGCVGPRLIDRTTGLQHGFHRIEGWQWTRVYPRISDRRPISCSNLNGSGTLVRSDLFCRLHGLDEDFFIDHVDTEWAFRVLASGYLLFGIPDARFDHAMGERGLRFWCFGWRVWPHRSPMRHYYLFRNALWLMRRNYVPRVWKSWAILKLGLTLLVHGVGDPLRKQQVRKMGTGIWHGIRRVPVFPLGKRQV